MVGDEVGFLGLGEQHRHGRKGSALKWTQHLVQGTEELGRTLREDGLCPSQAWKPL